MQTDPERHTSRRNSVRRRLGLFILVFNAYLLLEVLFIGPQYNLYAVLGPMLLTLGLGVACWPLCIVCGTPVGLVLLTSGGNEPPVEVRIGDELGVSTPR